MPSPHYIPEQNLRKHKMKKPIVLVGLMGCGKTAIGTRLAKKHGWHFEDLDHHIEAKEQMTISDIFAKKGEPYFRELEKQAMSELLLGDPNTIIASGGGAFIQPHIRELVEKFATSLWLKAEFDVLLERVSRKDTRPLLEQGDKAAILKSLMDERYPIYAQADIVVESKDEPHELVIERIEKALSL